MAIIPGQTLADSENDQSIRRPLRFHPVSGNIPVNQSKGKFRQLGEFASNLAFNVVDSALFGVPSSRMREGAEVRRDSFWSPAQTSYGEGWDRLGIRPWEELEGLPKLGMGIGQAAGFFIPFMKISKWSTALQRARFSNFDKLVGEAVKEASKNIDYVGVKTLPTMIRTALKGEKAKMPHIYRTTPEQYAQYSKSIENNLRLATAKAFENSRIPKQQVNSIADNIVRTLERFGQERRYIDNLPDVINQLGLREGAGRVAPYLSGYIGRAIDQGVNMAMFDFLGRSARAAFGEPMEGVDDIPLKESLAHSAGFAAAIALGDFVPGGRRAGAIQEFYKFARHNLSKKRSFVDLYKKSLATGAKKSKDHLTGDQIRTLAAYFGTLSRRAAPGKNGKALTSRNLAEGAGEPLQLAQWLDRTYSANKKELLSALMKDTGKSLVGSLPRAGVDAMITASYMGMTGSAIINDEALIGDYLVGAFMAMRAHQPLNPRHAMRWRYNNSIDAKFNFMEQMGADVSVLRDNLPAMSNNTFSMDFIASNLERTEGYDQIFNALYGENAESRQYSVTHNESKEGFSKERAFLTDLNLMFNAALIRNKNTPYNNADDIMQGIREGKLPDIYNLPDAEVQRIWSEVSEVRTRADKSIGEYDTFARFLEDYNEPVANYHMNMSINFAREAARALGIYKSDDIVEGGRERKMVVEGWRRDGAELTPETSYMLTMISELEKSGRVKVDTGNEVSLKNVDQAQAEKMQEIAERYHDRVATELDSNFNFSSSDNPSFSFIATHNLLKTKNRIYDALINTERPGDESQQVLMSHLRNIFDGKDTVSSRARYEVQLPSKKDDLNKLTDEEFSLREKAQTLIDDLVELKRASNMVNTERGAVKPVPYDDAVALLNFVRNSDLIRETGVGNRYGDMSHDQFREMIYTQSLVDSNLGELDFIALRTIQEATNQTGERVQMITDADQVEAVIRAYLTRDGQEKSNNEKIAEYTKNYMDVVERLRKTGRIDDAPPVANLTDAERQNLLRSVEYVHEMYNQKVRADAESYRKFAENVNEKVSKAQADMQNLESRARSENITTDEFLSKSEEIVKELQTAENLNEILPHADVDFGNLLAQIERARSSISGTGEKLPAELFSLSSKISDMSRYLSAVEQLVNANKSSETFSFMAADMRNKLTQEIGEIARRENKEFSTEGRGVFDLLKDLNRIEGDYEKARQIVDAVRISSKQKQGISRNTVDFNSQLNVDSLKSALDMLLATQTRASNVASFVRRMQELGIDSFYDNSRISDTLIRKLTDQDNFRSNVEEIVRTIEEAAKRQKIDFNNIHDDVLREVFSVAQTAITRSYSRDYVKIENGNIVRRTEGNIPRTITHAFIESMKDFRMDEIKNEFTENNQIKRLTNLDGDYTAIEYALHRAYDTVVNRSKSFDEVGDLIKKGDTDQAVSRMFYDGADNADVHMHRPLFVDFKASDDPGIVFDLTPNTANRLLERFRSFSLNMIDGETNSARLEHWDSIRKNIEQSLSNIANQSGDRGAIQLGDVRAAIRAIYYGENIGKEYFWTQVGDDVNSSRDGQSRVFKYAHHVDNTNSTSLDSRMESHLADILDVMGRTENHRKVKAEASRRAKEGVRVAFYDDSNTTVAGLLRSTIESSLRNRFTNTRIQEES